MAEPLKYDPLRVQSIVNDFYKSIGEQPSGREGRPGLAEWGEDLGQIDPRVLKAVRAGIKANVMPTKSTPVPYGGLLESTTSLPALPFFIGDLLTGGKHELAKKAPEFAVEASDEYDRLVNKYLQKEGLDEATRLSGPQQFGLAAGEMIGQLPIPGRILKKVTNVLPAALKPAGWLAEYFGPTIEPKVSNYAVGTGVGGTLRTATSEPEGYAKGGLRRAPIRATAEGVVETLPPKLEGTQIRKEPGGNWMPGSVERIVSDLQRVLPINEPVKNWLDTKLTSYIKNDMATERDPVRQGIEQRVAKAEEAYARGQERIAKNQRKITEAKALGKNTTTAEARLAQEMADLEQKYQLDRSGVGLTTEYGNPFQVGARAERQFSNAPALATTPESKLWEDMTDYSVDQGEAVYVRNRPFLPEAYAEELSRIPYNAKVYELRNIARLNEFMAHIRDELYNSTRVGTDLPPDLRLNPEDLQKMNMDATVAHVGKIDAWRERNRIAADLLKSRNAATVTFKEYPGTGLEWKQLKMPEPKLEEGHVLGPVSGYPDLTGVIDQRTGRSVSSGATEAEALRTYKREERTKLLEEALQYEGSAMGHCVGGYCPPVAEGKTQIFSLRDAKGEPHVTIEVRPADVATGIRELPDEERNALAQQVKDQYYGGVMPGRSDEDKFFKLVDQAYVEKYGEPLPSIIQIKGKGNLRPADKYIPFVQDFVKSREWMGVNDLKHTDLRQPVDLTRTDLLNLGISEPDFQKAFGERAYQYLTKEEIEDIVRSYKNPKQFAEGGAVEYDESRVKKLVDDFRQTMLGVPRKLKQAAADITEIGPIIKRSNEIPLKYFDEKTEVDGAADAMRHILFQGQLMRKYGETPAKTISYVHEYTSPGQAAEARAMDLYNDEIGRELGRVAKSDEELIDLAEKYVRSGKAKTLSGSRGGY